jgi:ComF family protein
VNERRHALFEKFHYVISFIYPSCCLTCDRMMRPDERMICDACWDRLRYVKGKVEEGIIERSHIEEIRSGVYYDDLFQQIIHQFKYQRALILAEKFASILSEVILNEEAWKMSHLLIPVPLHPVKMRERSYNQSEEIGRRLSRMVKMPYRADIVERTVNTLSQTKMPTAGDRVKNMAEVFSVIKPSFVQGQNLILIDDLITTGATANSCARALVMAGAKSIRVLTVARPILE